MYGRKNMIVEHYRDYNDEHLYTDWSDMGLDGKSTRIAHPSNGHGYTPYDLGCGPALTKYKGYKGVCTSK